MDLPALAAQIAAAADQVKAFKTSGGSKDDITAAVNQLLQLKQQYAANNNGLGVDGQPYQPPLSNKEKKAKAKAEKAAKAAAAAQEGEGEQGEGEVGTCTTVLLVIFCTPSLSHFPQSGESKNATKKAAKKAAKQAAKQGNAEGTETAKPPPKKTPPSAQYYYKVAPNTLVIAPDCSDPPHLLLAAAIMNDTIIDLEITSDARCPYSAALGTDDGIVVSNAAMTRAWTTVSPVVDVWLDFSTKCSGMTEPQRETALVLTLEKALAQSTYLVGHDLSLADVALYHALGWNEARVPASARHTQRWIEMVARHPVILQATQLVYWSRGQEPPSTLDPLVKGMVPLEGAVPGRVVTRFPPEPSGYLHIGHAKAVLLNDYYARRYQGRLLVRFDDTNPTKEKQEYQEAIVEDLKLLGVVPDQVSFTSDSFPYIQDCARRLIAQGDAYMDDTPQELMKQERANRVESKHRNQSVQEALDLFDKMCAGEGPTWCLRAKIDMASDNGTLRDPVLYRPNATPHHRTGTKYHAYPTYDLACPIVDSIEGVTHALRTTEYNDRDVQYQWLLQKLNLRRVRIHAFSRVNFKYTLLSKRKLTWFVDAGQVTGWDDARMPTIRGICRRGVQVPCLRQFMYQQGASRRIVLMDWTVFWSENKRDLDKMAKRYMAIDATEQANIHVTNVEADANAFVEASLHPKDPSMGTRAVRIANKVVCEAVDMEGVVVDETIVLMRWGVIRITKVIDARNYEAVFVPNGDIKACPRKLSWMAADHHVRTILHEFDNLVSKEKLEEDDDFMDFINPNTLATTQVWGDPGLLTLQQNDIIQLERRGFYRVDRPYINDTKPLLLYMIPDGKAKAMSGLAGKLAHR